MNLNRYTFDVDDLDLREVFSETTQNLGVLFVGAAIGMEIMSGYMLSRFCLRSTTIGVSGLLGQHCEPARRLATEYFLGSMGLGVGLLLVGLLTAIHWRDD